MKEITAMRRMLRTAVVTILGFVLVAGLTYYALEPTGVDDTSEEANLNLYTALAATRDIRQVQAETSALHAGLLGTKVRLNDKLVTLKAENITTDTLKGLLEAAEREVRLLVSPFNGETSFTVLYFDGDGELVVGGESVSEKVIAGFTKQASIRVELAEAAVTGYETELLAEKERIRIAEEEARKAAEAAAKARGNSGGGKRASSGGGGSGEDQYARVSRIAASLPFSLPNWNIYDYQCTNHTGALACYSLTTGQIYITNAGLRRSDCKVREALAHEYRHWWQHQNGWVKLENNSIVNVSDMEKDAKTFGLKYGC